MRGFIQLWPRYSFNWPPLILSAGKRGRIPPRGLGPSTRTHRFTEPLPTESFVQPARKRLTQPHTRGFFQPAEHGGEVGHTCIRSADGCRSSDLKPIRASGLVFRRAYPARPSRWDERHTLPEGLLTLSRALSARTASPEASNWRANRG